MANAWARAREEVLGRWVAEIRACETGELERYGLTMPLEALVQVEQRALFEEMAYCMEQGDETIRIADVRSRIDADLVREVLSDGRFDEEMESAVWELTRGGLDHEVADRVAEIALAAIGRACDSPAVDSTAPDSGTRDLAELYIDAYATPGNYPDLPDITDTAAEIAQQVTEATGPERSSLSGDALSDALGRRLAAAAMERAANGPVPACVNGDGAPRAVETVRGLGGER